MSERLPKSRFALFFVLATVGVLADLITKSLVFNNFFNGNYQEPYWLIEPYFGIQCSTNPGALFGLGSGLSWLFAAISIVAIAALTVWLFVFKAAKDLWLTIAIGIVTGGILGNLYDRVGLGWKPEYPESIKTNVRDWIYFQVEGVSIFDPWPNFNIADSLLVCGAIMLFIHAFMPQPEENSTKSITTKDDEEAGVNNDE